jgi:hypothetical protein
VECGRRSEVGATGWRAYLGTEEEVGTDDEAFTFCPERASREFGSSPLKPFSPTARQVAGRPVNAPFTSTKAATGPIPVKPGLGRKSG